MSAVHMVVNKPMAGSEYAVFSALLRVFLLMGFPAGGLQVVFARQAAASVSEHEERMLSKTTRSVLRATFLIWLAIAAIVLLFQTRILVMLKITNPAALWVTVLLSLASLWAPVLKGILQGRQNFAGLGWVLILDGVGRFTAIVLIVHLGGQAAGAMTGALIGQIVSFTVAAWLVWRVITGPGAPFIWRPWLQRVVPLTFGCGVVLFMCNADVIYVQSIFSKDETRFYMAAAMIGLALVTFTTPMASVMFPKIAQSAARTEKTDALRHALATTALLGGLAAGACTLLPALPLRIIYFRNADYWASAPLVPWFAWALLPLIVANVLIGNLLARDRFRIVPWTVLVAIGYGTTLLMLSERITALSPQDIKDAPGLVHRLQARSDPVSSFLGEQLPLQARPQLSAPVSNPAQLKMILAESLNSVLSGGSIYRPERFAQIQLPERVVKLLADNPQGRDVIRLNRMLLQAAFPAELASNSEMLFWRFKMVIGTLGAFSSLLLLVAVWCTFSGSALRNAPFRVLRDSA
jgi:O-antigen/teichoic acid export membrane protein